MPEVCVVLRDFPFYSKILPHVDKKIGGQDPAATWKQKSFFSISKLDVREDVVFQLYGFFFFFENLGSQL